MYSTRDFKRDWRGLLLVSAAGLALILVTFTRAGELDALHEIRTKPAEFAGGCLAIMVFLFVCLLCYRSAWFIRHKGWRALLILFGVAAFFLPFLNLVGESRVRPWDFIEHGMLGLVAAALAILVPQRVYRRIQRIRALWKRSQ